MDGGKSLANPAGQVIDGYQGKCDLTPAFGHLPGAVALDLDNKAVGWKMGLTSSIAIMPVECFELAAGLIVYQFIRSIAF